ncbi:DEAD/DEAH box helicase family protein [Chryseobacterium sp. APV1]|uniref:DEAD/DEAH box helicase family protein n=1 Tax=Chryseobacterium urinae TaxID=3058400 RepID=A0ABT8TYW2_9FLAO|nr:DEAD/DEAH box helicase family protein [Chryseobacterium sp. APV1]MDO3423987.1 DEAD/DEAH box helicase family protein [Chryseobacterium sp. APV1]
MNIFKKINEQQNNEVVLPSEPIDLFYSLKKEKDFAFLRDAQNEVLSEWYKRKGEKNLLIKMNTGAGKTLVGLLILYSKMLETKKKCLFLCPDKQLVNQVLEQSKNYSIPTCIFDEDENDFPEEFLNNEAILITTVQKLFNGKNKFDKQKIEIESIVIDDAHRCIEKIKDSFTIKIPNDNQMYDNLVNLFTDELRRQAIGSFEAIKMQHPEYYMKLPFWSWLDNEQAVIRIMSNQIGDKDTLLFKWDLFYNNYKQYELYLKYQGIEISPIKCFTTNIETYKNAKNVYALSATFENEKSLLFDLDFTLDSILNPVEPKNKKDYGQRLILSPKRYFRDFDMDDLKEIINHHLSNNENILVLVPSYRDARSWESLGAKIIIENIVEELDCLKRTKGNFIVIANRYDGIDLGGDACNVLIIYEHPNYKFIKDKYYENISHKSETNLIAQTLEQGLGRTVRSGSDYSVVYLLGKNILRFLRQKDNFKYLNKHTKKQIEMGLDLLSNVGDVKKEEIAKTIYETADYCLSQNSDWLLYYQNFMKNESNSEELDKEEVLQLKQLEKEAIVEFVKGNHKNSVDRINTILNQNLTNSENAIYLTLKANILYEIDKNGSNDLIIKSREFSRHMFEPFLAQEYTKKQLKAGNQFEKAKAFLHNFSTTNDAIDTMNEIISGLVYDESNPSDRFENSINLLGKVLGFISFRPEKEKYEGSDNLWLMENNVCLIMESKSEKLHKNLISKTDISQLMHSVNWFGEKYLNDNLVVYGVTLQYNRRKETNVTVNDEIKVIDHESLEKLKDSLSKYISFLSKNNVREITIDKIKAEFVSLKFSNDLFINSYLKSII